MTDEIQNPTVDRVRQARAKLVEDAGGELGKLVEMLQKAERASGKPTRSPREVRKRAQTRPPADLT